MIKIALGVVVGSALAASVAQAAPCPNYPYTLANNTTADATQVMADFNCAALTGGPGPITVGSGYNLQFTAGAGDIAAGGAGGFLHFRAPTLYIQRSSGDALGSTVQLRKSRGIASAPSVITSGDSIATIRGYGYDGSAFTEATRISFGTQGTIGAGIVPGLIDFYASNSAGTPTRTTSIDTTGVIQRVGQIQGVSAATAAAPAFAFASDLTTGLFRPGTHVLGFATNGVEAARFDSSGNLFVGTTAQAGYKFYVNGTAGGSGAWTVPSDVRLKEDVTPITGALALVERLQGVRYRWRPPAAREVGKSMQLPVDEPQIGLVAQDVAKVVPEAVALPKDSPDGVYGLREGNLVPLLVEAVKEQQQEISDLRAEVAELKARAGGLATR